MTITVLKAEGALSELAEELSASLKQSRERPDNFSFYTLKGWRDNIKELLEKIEPLISSDKELQRYWFAVKESIYDELVDILIADPANFKHPDA